MAEHSRLARPIGRRVVDLKPVHEPVVDVEIHGDVTYPGDDNIGGQSSISWNDYGSIGADTKDCVPAVRVVDAIGHGHEGQLPLDISFK